MGEKRKREEMEHDKENDGAQELNKSNEKRSKETEVEDTSKLIEVNKKVSPESNETKPVEDDDEEEVIDTNNNKNKKTEVITSEKRRVKPVDEEESKVEKGAIGEFIEEAVVGGEDEENEYNMDEKDFEKLKEGDEESEEDKVSLDDESIGGLQEEDEFDLQAYLKFREQEDA